MFIQEELFYLWMCVEKNQQTFIGYYLNPHISSLVSKGLLVPANNSDIWNCPLTIPDFIWEHLQENKHSFLPQNINDLKTTIQTFERLPDWQRKNFP